MAPLTSRDSRSSAASALASDAAMTVAPAAANGLVPTETKTEANGAVRVRRQIEIQLSPPTAIQLCVN